MPLTERRNIVGNLRMVDEIVTYNDADGSSREAIREVRRRYPGDRIIFANGGDRTARNIPEMDVDTDNIQFLFGVGGEHKANSSSWILEDWKAPKTRRPWGYYRVLHEVPGVKVKELTVEPGGALSMQRHRDRAEFWLVSSGRATVNTINRSTDLEPRGIYERHQHLHIDTNEWHQLVNNEASPLKIVEIQYGDRCEEEDIERKLL
jgi:mannose-6-phosphate isomerase-like protein (cupin superfamily)